MKFATIPPIANCRLALQGDFLFALAQYVNEDNKDYVEFFKKYSTSTTVYIDNGVAEHQRISHEELINRAHQINARVIICPDELHNRIKTVSLIEEFISILSPAELRKFTLMAVPHGNSSSDYLECYHNIQEQGVIHFFGLSKFDVPEHFRDRIKCYTRLKNSSHREDRFHLLGFIKDFTEYKFFAKRGDVISCDSCVLVEAALHKQRLELIKSPLYTRIPYTSEYFKHNMTVDEVRIASHNIKEFSKLIATQ